MGYYTDQVGDIEFPDKVNVRRPAHIVIPKVVISLVAIAALYFCTFTMSPIPLDGRCLTLLTVGLFLYVGLAWFVRPAPNMDNLGWFGGMYNDLGSYSDDENRRLLGFQLVLLPGLIVAGSFVELATLLGCIPEVTPQDLKKHRSVELDTMATKSSTEPEHSVELSSARFMKSPSE